MKSEKIETYLEAMRNQLNRALSHIKDGDDAEDAVKALDIATKLNVTAEVLNDKIGGLL